MQTHLQRKGTSGWGAGESPEPLAPGVALAPRCPAAHALLCFLPSSSASHAAAGGRLQTGHRPDPATAREPSPTAGRARKRGSKSPGKDEELGGGKPKARSLLCSGSPRGPVPRWASAAGLGRTGSGPVPGPARCRAAGGDLPPPSGHRLSAQRCRDTSHVPAPSLLPPCRGHSSRPGDRRCPAHREPPERGAAAITRFASHNLLRGRSESPPH